LGASINSFWNTNAGIFSDTRRQKRQPAGEAGSLSSLNEYFGNLPLQAGAVAVKKAQVGKQNGVIRGAHYSTSAMSYHLPCFQFNIFINYMY